MGSRAVALAAWVVLLAAGAVSGAPCGALVCLQAAAGARGDCAAEAEDDFTEAKSLCQDRAPVCVMACAWRREECRTAIGFVRGQEACDEELQRATAECIARHARGSVRRALCLDRAELAHVRCRARVRRETRRERRRCDREIVVCVEGCGPGSPPGGSVACRAEASRTLKSELAACAATARATRSTCLDKDSTCVQDCRAARDACSGPARASLASALVVCDTEERTAATACAGDATCVQSAESAGFACREAARAAASPALEACAGAYLRCGRDCPAPAAEPAVAGGTAAARARSACTLAGDGALR
jgi:hypothetical protein